MRCLEEALDAKGLHSTKGSQICGLAVAGAPAACSYKCLSNSENSMLEGLSSRLCILHPRQADCESSCGFRYFESGFFFIDRYQRHKFLQLTIGKTLMIANRRCTLDVIAGVE